MSLYCQPTLVTIFSLNILLSYNNVLVVITTNQKMSKVNVNKHETRKVF